MVPELCLVEMHCQCNVALKNYHQNPKISESNTDESDFDAVILIHPELNPTDLEAARPFKESNLPRGQSTPLHSTVLIKEGKKAGGGGARS